MIQARVIKPHDIEFFEVPAPEAKDLKDNEIGRASCRERVF